MGNSTCCGGNTQKDELTEAVRNISREGKEELLPEHGFISPGGPGANKSKLVSFKEKQLADGTDTSAKVRAAPAPLTMIDEDEHAEEQQAPPSLVRSISAVSFHGIDIPEDDAQAEAMAKGPQKAPIQPKRSINRVSTPAAGALKHTLSGSSLTRAASKSLTDVAKRTEGFFFAKSPTAKEATEKEPEIPDLDGTWVCIDTWGLDDFLKEMGVNYMKRLAASKAPWPSWDFQQDGNSISFTNHTMMGEISESFVVGGAEYTAIDGQKQALTCKATWEGHKLIIHRKGPQGRFKEEREIDGDILVFKLTGLEEGQKSTWGRKFKRKEI
mmetsp:Transcript_1090/g.2213  ORF Transcript_1090/g.2213 Transcript_1090/m.2213 type:complete len:327 (+) Transcript_1090:21-1001(+)|eukprot:CAMPEP_0197661622 /NCGR_PEP_ID=MMETSP1338-20131121/51562_1 /TAXON_ID=43686 ORGANISM="Pelagodinium beii, Strain RCC1491" /NCGR_SAMPLE_ID=MMETSP1338 /ASSEMBLY_ACC=CAM_ASM_000754 /LENGTH=326 /DNA_ID=CAMNT_0043239201 /DNA_START=17 /DNA_END=997 /DNA_ORIENTATION=-